MLNLLNLFEKPWFKQVSIFFYQNVKFGGKSFAVLHNDLPKALGCLSLEIFANVESYELKAAAIEWIYRWYLREHKRL